MTMAQMLKIVGLLTAAVFFSSLFSTVVFAISATPIRWLRARRTLSSGVGGRLQRSRLGNAMAFRAGARSYAANNGPTPELLRVVKASVSETIPATGMFDIAVSHDDANGRWIASICLKDRPDDWCVTGQDHDLGTLFSRLGAEALMKISRGRP